MFGMVSPDPLALSIITDLRQVTRQSAEVEVRFYYASRNGITLMSCRTT